MSAPTGISWGVDVFRAFAVPLDSGGLPLASLLSMIPYEGTEFHYVTSFDATWAKPRTIVNVAQGRVRDLIYLPPNTASTAILKMSYEDQIAIATMMGVKRVTTEGNRSFVSLMTDKAGHEPNVMFYINQLASHDNYGNVDWRTFFMPRVRLIYTGDSFNNNASVYEFEMAIAKSLKAFSGLPLTVAVNGVTEEGAEINQSPNCTHACWYVSDGTTLDFLVPATCPIADFTTPEAALYDMTAGTQITASITFDATGAHLATGHAVTSGHVCQLIYGYAA